LKGRFSSLTYRRTRVDKTQVRLDDVISITNAQATETMQELLWPLPQMAVIPCRTTTIEPTTWVTTKVTSANPNLQFGSIDLFFGNTTGSLCEFCRRMLQTQQ